MVRKKINDRKQSVRRGGLRFSILLLLLASIVVFLLSSSSGERYGIFHQLTLETLGPLQGLATRVSLSVGKITDKYIALWNLQEENEQLRRELETYHAQLDEFRKAYARNRFLETALEFKQQDSFPSLTARVVGKDPSFWFQTLIVDRGKNDGVVIGMVARSPRGVVGQVVQVSDNYSKVLLANAPSSAIDAVVQSSRVRGILKGAGEKGYVLQYVLKNADIKEGDIIVTAGIGGVFPSGVTLGTVSRVYAKRRGMFLDVEVQPAVDFSTLEFLFINLSEEHLIIDKMGHASATGE